MFVRVREIPVRYGDKTYMPGEIIEIDEKYFESMKKHVDTFTKETKTAITEKMLESLGYNELKKFLKEQGVNIGKVRKHDEILQLAKKELL